MNTGHIVLDTDLGPITLVANDEAVAGLYFRHHIRRPAREKFGPEVAASADPLLSEAARQLHDYLAGERCEFELPLAVGGDDFQHAVRDIVASVPRGETATACATNPLPVVPCHRVLRTDGTLGCLAAKTALRDLERVA